MLEKIKEILVEQLNCDADSINEDTSFKDDLGADSLDLYEMVMALEDEGWCSSEETPGCFPF